MPEPQSEKHPTSAANTLPNATAYTQKAIAMPTFAFSKASIMISFRSSYTSGGAAPAAFHGLGRKRSHLASAEMVRAEFVKFDQGMIVGSFCL